MALVAGCSGDVGSTGEREVDSHEIGESTQAFTSAGSYSYGVTTQVALVDIGTANGRFCYTSGFAANLHMVDTIGVGRDDTVKPPRWEMELNTFSGLPVGMFARCFYTNQIPKFDPAKGLQLEHTSGKVKTATLGPRSPGELATLFAMANGLDGAFAFGSASDYVKIRTTDPGDTWTLEYRISGDIILTWGAIGGFTAFNGEVEWDAPPSGSSRLSLGTTTTGMNCFLTGFGGPFTSNDWSDGVYLSEDTTAHVNYLNVSNGKRGWAYCAS
jgi:hypothetical protein